MIMQLPHYLGRTIAAEKELTESLQKVAIKHVADVDVMITCKTLAAWSEDHVENLKKRSEKYGVKKHSEPAALANVVLNFNMSSLGLLSDLHGLWLMACEVEMCYIILSQAAKALRDKELTLTCEQYCTFTNRQKAWFQTKIKSMASQTLVATE